MNEFDKSISEILEVEKVNDMDKLESFECWDSLTVLSIIALMDQQFGINLSAADVVAAKTIKGLKELAGLRKK